MIIVTLGDPLSINVEAVSHLLAEKPRNPVILVGSHWHFQDQLGRIGKSVEVATLRADENPRRLPMKGEIHFWDIGGYERRAELLTDDERGRIALQTLEIIGRFRDVPIQAVVTAPIDKKAVHAAGFKFPGQTEFFENLWAGHGIMLLAGPRLRVGLATNHLPLSAVEASLTPEVLEEKVERLHWTLVNIFGMRMPRIAVCGLNPHCGDGGIFGNFDQAVAAPVIEQLKDKFAVLGPIPADTVFYRAMHGEFDAVLAMYHDQGLGPLKTVEFDSSINVTGGLKHLRVSPDHGPAQDRFLKGTASFTSFRHCWELANSYLDSQTSLLVSDIGALRQP
jgi:4-hydroxythreonine-4-phosphate dehydrogenase